MAHEYAHGYAALRQGDDTALQQGRLTLNPLAHIDPWLTIIMPALLWFASRGAFTFGGARPVQVRPDKYRHFVRGDIIVSSAGVITNLFLSIVAGALFVLLGLLARAAPGIESVIGTAQRMLTWAVWLNLMLASFNILPIPPLDGSHLFYHLLPRALRRRYQTLQRFGFLPLLALILFAPGAIRWLLSPAIAGMRFFVEWAAPYAAGPQWNIFPS